ncbi:endonuclease [Kluyveromyces lactis]|uniref:Structure-specific endonuclease subunit SLX1 n=1 Tax=Kluyveromyces lactis (strain ATCC 8585 / CBS 2359 / DSM 70799 / NBRC 1267 / NRRL Y-1140 / WM37) TaxID=284590 RepID=SLX1_KLULA|nr:uncharacterized protein KLLA0_F09713g [Kluyveromyces lactis]Q6CKL8.1 RecName: Full=Structure-specific endonuclease subunit SLX1 [Kluyveromyces lactis NRRL Y-1140]CAG98229.1 KLLA0F09713p [Kluyveromyces lactis]|eukprot:XP_455521.1 uncharacterized protein KLLA0_F09713g [Kluyveromyces lactis]
MSNKQHRVPDFYCSYLLRSIPKPNSFYIGSSPDPVRRLRQHNGAVRRGGAYRTKRNGTRPWKMVCFIYGFTSKIAALQFEHAWQHSYKTRFIENNERLVTKKNTRNGIATKLGNARLLMKHPYFDKMNLHIRFFDRLAWESWELNKFKVDYGLSLCEVDEAVLTDESQLDELDELNLERIKAFYEDQMAQESSLLQRYQDNLTYDQKSCMICDKKIDYIHDEGTQMVGFCSDDECDFLSCLSCLYKEFTKNSKQIIPKSGHCPNCHKCLEWSQIVKYSTVLREKLIKD